ncbi:PD-(D/E)XK nuclease family protein [Streptomyces sp. NPDC037389]|uniref:PD-(D/E)XK nuclease family protein n=1 Tax=Streptomyces sp. NPDC037389 TaxID=3155369 RepID=UPI0033D8F097
MSIETQPRSVSQTQQYEECAWRFYLQRVERVVPRPAAWSHHGTAFHAAAEAVERSGRTMAAEEAVTLFSEHYSAAVNASLDAEPDTDRWLAAGVTPAEDIERRYRLGQEQTAHYVAWSREHQPEIWVTPSGQPALELAFQVELGGVRVRGFIDQVTVETDGTLRIRDLKTGSTKSRFQLETYGVAVERAYDVPVGCGDWYLAKGGRLSRPVALDGVTEESVGERFAAMDAGVKRGDFPARPGFSCRFCDVSHACSAK